MFRSFLNPKPYTLNPSGGFTLPEILVYLAILAVMFVIIINSLLTMTKGFKALNLTRDLDTSAIASLERIVREVRQASNVDQAASILGASPGKLVLNSTDSAGAATTVEFSIVGDKLEVKQDGVTVGPLTLASTTVDILIFRLIQTGASKAIKVELQFTAGNSSGFKTEKFYTTAVLRGSYGG